MHSVPALPKSSGGGSWPDLFRRALAVICLHFQRVVSLPHTHTHKLSALSLPPGGSLRAMLTAVAMVVCACKLPEMVFPWTQIGMALRAEVSEAGGSAMSALLRGQD